MTAKDRVRIAVTGAAGRVGRHVCAGLRGLGFYVVALDRQQLPTAAASGLADAWVQDGLGDPSSLARHLRDCDAVLHLAGAVPAAGRLDHEYREGNVWTTAVVAEAAARAGVHTLVLASTAHVYGSDAPDAVDESAELRPGSGYAKSKVAAELTAAAWATAGGATVVLARLGSLYGFLPADETVLGRLVGQARRGEPFRVRSVADVRDFTHVADAAEALVRLAQRRWAAPVTAVNVSAGVGVDVGELVRQVQVAAGRTGEAVTIEEPAAARTMLVMDTRRLHEIVGVLPFRSVALGVTGMFSEPTNGGRVA